jgi:hypothetical protein
MRVKLVATLGALIGVCILVAATLTVNGTALHSFQALDQQARQQDKSVASTSAQPCANPRLQVSARTRVLLDSETEALSIRVTNQDTVQCDITVSLVAPKFTLQPTDNQQLISLAPTASSSLTWTVKPTAVGLYTLAFTAGNASQQIGVSIVSGNGFTPLQPQTFNYVAIFLGLLMTLVCMMVFVWRGSPQSPHTAESAGSRREQPLPAQPASVPPPVRSEDTSNVAV